LGLREYLIPNKKFPMNFELLYVFFCPFSKLLASCRRTSENSVKTKFVEFHF